MTSIRPRMASFFTRHDPFFSSDRVKKGSSKRVNSFLQRSLWRESTPFPKITVSSILLTATFFSFSSRNSFISSRMLWAIGWRALSLTVITDGVILCFRADARSET